MAGVPGGRQTLVDKIWRRHQMTEVEGERLLYADYLLLHEGARHGFDDLAEMGRAVHRPQRGLVLAALRSERAHSSALEPGSRSISIAK